MSEEKSTFWKNWVSPLIDIFFVILFFLPALSFISFGEAVPAQSNYEKFDSIKIDFSAAGINKEELLKKFEENPMAYRSSVDHHQRKRFMLFTEAQENAVGQLFVERMTALDILWQDKKARERCDRILSHLSKVMPEHFTQSAKVYILDVNEINACCLPGGIIVVYRGIIEFCNDDELAWVIAHELGHIVSRHWAEKASNAMIQDLAINIFTKDETEDGAVIKKTAGNIVALIANMKFSRTQEYEADRFALLYMNKAGFPLNGAVSLMKKFDSKEKKNDSKIEKLLSTHPHPEERLKNIQAATGELKEDPDHVWGGITDILMEKAAVKAIDYYTEKKRREEKKGSK